MGRKRVDVRTTPSPTNHERTPLEDLRRVIHDVRAPFACGGAFVPDQLVTLAFPDMTPIAVLRAPNTYEQERLLQPLVDRCTAALFSHGRKTVPSFAHAPPYGLKTHGPRSSRR